MRDCERCGIAKTMMRQPDPKKGYVCLLCGARAEATDTPQGHPSLASTIARSSKTKQQEPEVDDDALTDTLDDLIIHYLCRRSAERYIPDLEFNENIAMFHRWLHRSDARKRKHKYDA